MIRLASFLFFFVLATPGLAASSAWHVTEGGAVRLITAETAEDGMLRGALEIRLEPDWKTYWLDPGEWGVPPQVELAGSAMDLPVKIRFPAPKWMEDELSAWAGYDRSTLLALELPGDTTLPLAANVFLGICRSICIPVQAELTVESRPQSDPREAMLLEAAFAGLPEAPDRDFGVTALLPDRDRKQLQAFVALPADSESVELFLADQGGWKFGRPAPMQGKGEALSVPVIAWPEDLAAAELTYTLVSGGRAVEGTIRLGAQP